MTTDGTLMSQTVVVIQEIQDTVFVGGSIGPAPRVVLSDLAVMTEGMRVRVSDSGTTEAQDRRSAEQAVKSSEDLDPPSATGDTTVMTPSGGSL